MALHALKLTEMKKITSTGLNLIPRGCTGTHSYLLAGQCAIEMANYCCQIATGQGKSSQQKQTTCSRLSLTVKCGSVFM